VTTGVRVCVCVGAVRCLGSGVHGAVPTGVPATGARTVVPLSQPTRSRGERFDLGRTVAAWLVRLHTEQLCCV